MRTGEDVRELGLYVSDCCLEELLFDKDDSFSRCPRCSSLCGWELIETLVAAEHMWAVNGRNDEAL